MPLVVTDSLVLQLLLFFTINLSYRCVTCPVCMEQDTTQVCFKIVLLLDPKQPIRKHGMPVSSDH